MSEHAKQLHATANAQITELIGLVSALDDATIRLPCGAGLQALTERGPHGP